MNISKNYMLVNLPYIKKDIAHFKKYADLAHKRFEHRYGKQPTTNLYNQYNSMTLLVGSVKYYKMLKMFLKLLESMLILKNLYGCSRG